jgi:hypothetical protein
LLAAVLSARRHYLAAAQVVLTVLPIIQEQALEVHHKLGAIVAKGRKRRRLQRARTKAKARATMPPRIPLQLPVALAFVHTNTFEPGPLHSDASTSKVISCRAYCTKRAASSPGSGRWGAFMRGICGAHPLAAHARREYLPHALCPVFGGWPFLRCRLPVAPGRRSAAEAARCPLPEVIGSDGHSCSSTRLQLQCNADVIAAWHAFRKLVAPPSVVPPPSLAPVGLLQCHPHWKLVFGRAEVCLQCGKTASTRARNSLCLRHALVPFPHRLVS